MSDFLQTMTVEMSAGFLNSWNSSRDHREKIEMVRMTDNKYRSDHAVTATQKTIRKVFGMDEK